MSQTTKRLSERDASQTKQYSFGCSTIVPLNAGEYIDLRCLTSTVTGGNASQSNGSANHIDIEMIK